MRNAVNQQLQQYTLGQLIRELEEIKIDPGSKYEPLVFFDFEYLRPKGVCSWRGSYSELAITFVMDGEFMLLKKFIEILKDTVGKELTGWKGGEFMMTEDTPVWVSNHGNSGHTGICGVHYDGSNAILLTATFEY